MHTLMLTAELEATTTSRTVTGEEHSSSALTATTLEAINLK